MDSIKRVIRAGLLAAIVSPIATHAQAAYLPSMKIGTAALISPSAGDSFYGSSTTHTNGLSTTNRPPEIVEMARALKNSPDLIYEYVRNNIKVAWMYGLQKGALGALIDKSGTPFDQAVLMVELLRQAGFTANYQAGTITLTSSQFYDWTGIQYATPACQLLSSGGIPAVINGSTTANCAYGSETAISSVQLSHIWVQVNIGGTNYVFDPAYKPHTWKTGINLATATGFTSGTPLSAATTGMSSGTSSGVPYVKTLNSSTTNLNTTLQGYASSLLTYLQAHNVPGTNTQLTAGEIEDIVGGGVIQPYVSPPGGLRQTTLPYTNSVDHTWSCVDTDHCGVPDQYRTTLEVKAVDNDIDVVGAVMFDKTLYVDEIYGRRLEINTNFNFSEIGLPSDYNTFVARLQLDGVTLLTYSHTSTAGYAAPKNRKRSDLTLAANHPYAASADGSTTTDGTYMDATVEKKMMLITGATIVHGWGDTGPELLAKWSGERASDTIGPREVATYTCETCVSDYESPTGDFTRNKMAAGWLVQTTRAIEINAAIAVSTLQMHHEVGVLYADDHAPSIPGSTTPASPDYAVADSYTRLDIDTGISLTSRSADAPTRRGALFSIAATSATLEGSIAGQIMDVPDTASTAARFEWGNAPPPCPYPLTTPCQDPSGAGPRSFFQFNNATQGAAAPGIVIWEGTTTVPPSDTTDHYGNPQTAGALFKSSLSDLIQSYTDANFVVVASQESFLGPGQRGGWWGPGGGGPGTPGSYTETKQRGSAIVATRYNGDDPVEIAHIVSAETGLDTKGGGGAVEPGTGPAYDPAQAADVLKAHFVDRSNVLGVNIANGSLAYSSPAIVTAGNGNFPYSLSGSLVFHPKPVTPAEFGPPSVEYTQSGWSTNWTNSLSMSGSGMEALGASDMRAAAGAIVAFLAAQDIFKSSAAPERDSAGVLALAWWAHQTVGNVASATVGGSTRQFVRLSDDSWIAPGSGPPATLAPTGARVAYNYICPPWGGGTNQPFYALSRGWDYSSGLSFAITSASGDTQNFGYWQNTYYNAGNYCSRHVGFRLDSWTFPQGPSVSLTYVSSDPYITYGDVPASVSNNLGRQIDFTYTTGILSAIADHNVSAHNIAITTGSGNIASNTDAESALTQFTYVGPTARSDTQRPIPWQQLYQVYAADNTMTPNTQFDYDTLGHVKQVHDAVNLQVGGRDPWKFYIADGTRGERDDPLGQAYSVVYDIYGHPARYIDELAHETDALIDSRGRPSYYIYPEGDCESFGYDDRNNTTDYWRVDTASSCNTGAGSSHVLHVGATWDTSWNKPLTITDARGNTTAMTYYASGAGASLLHTATRPTITEGSPVYSFTYDGVGKPLTATVPFGGAGIVTTNSYDATTHDLLTSTLDSGGVAATTSFAYDAAGDVVTTTDPRGNVTTSSYDNDRRKTEDDHHNGGSGAALIAAGRTVYDLLGRESHSDVGTAFSGTTVTTWLTVKTTTYTPTSKVATVTDADSRTVTTAYDNADRVFTVTDPLSRKTHTVYCVFGDSDCAANQVRIELRAWAGSSNACSVTGTLQQCYRTLSYFADGEKKTIADANGNTTTYAYDGFVRPQRTTFPDASYEQSTLDENGNVTALRNRRAQTLTYSFNALNWMTAKVSPSPSLTTSWTYKLNGAVNTVGDTAGNTVAYGYDTAGRQTSESNTIAGLGGTKTAAYGLDAAGNRTSLTWPDGYAVTYGYDALNRMTTAVDSGSVSLATYSYDPQSRRTALAYGNSASVAYTYTNAGDLLTLNHSLAASPDSPHFTFTYTAAHELASEANSLSAYMLAPPTTGMTGYGTANNLNQYPTVTPPGGSPLTQHYDTSGNLTDDGVTTFAYDAENRLLTASKTGLVATYAYDPLGRRTQKSGTGVTATFFVSSGTDEIADYNGAGSLVTRYVPGPAIDEPIAVVPVSGTISYFHTNHQGSVVSMSGAGAALAEGPYLYDPFGNCTAGGSPCSSGEPYRFTGRRLDPETGLLYYRARYYSPATGRFNQVDPVGYDVDLNLYVYVGNDPLDGKDATGLSANLCSRTGASSCAGSYNGDGTGQTRGRGPENPNKGRSPQTTHNERQALDSLAPAISRATSTARAGATASVSAVAALTTIILLATTTSTAGPDMDEARRVILYHYTTESGAAGIVAEQRINPSLRSQNPNDARYGNGQYFTDISPGAMSNAQLSRALVGIPFAGNRFTNFVAVDVFGLAVANPRAHVFLVPNEEPLNVEGRITAAGRN